MTDTIQVENKDKKKDETILNMARKRFRFSEDAESDIRKQALDDVRFRAGHQWDDSVSKIRKNSNRPCFTVNRMPQFVRQITNDQRQNRPSIKVKPVDDKSDVETSKILQGLIRHIELNSNADAAYDTGFQHAVEGGFGFFRVTTEYCDENSFDQDILIRRVPNQFSCRLDPTYQEPDGSDANWGFCSEDLSKEEYESQWGESKLAKLDTWDGLGAELAHWVGEESVRVAEYFYKEFTTVKIVQLVDGRTVEKKELSEDFPADQIKNERDSVHTVIHWVKMNGYEILERTTWLGKWIPIIPILGDELIVDGKRVLEGAIRHAKDPQKLHNYYVSSQAEAIALAPKAPFIGAAGAFDGFEKKWQTANSENHAFLEYNTMSEGGKPLPPPQRNFGEPNVQAITMAKSESADDIKATTGIYDAALGARSSETSGVAIQRRTMQAQTANFHFVDNLTRSIKHGGRILVDLIPKIYDTDRAVRIIGEDQQEKIMMIQQVVDPETGKNQSPFEGKYDVAVDVGPSFQTKRQEAMESMLEFIKVYPQAAPLLGDLIARYGDWPGSEEVAGRLKTMLPPQLQENENGEKGPDPAAQAREEQMGQMIDQLMDKLEDANKKIENKSMEIESRERIELLKIETDLKKEVYRQEGVDARQMLNAEMREIDLRQKSLDMRSAARQQEQLAEKQAAQQSAGPGPQQNNQQPTGGPPPGQNIEG